MRKRISTRILGLVAILVFFVCTGLVLAEDNSASNADNIQYSVIQDTLSPEQQGKELEVTGIQDQSSADGLAEGTVVIPKKVTIDQNEYTVTRIGDNAVAQDSQIKNIVIPDSVTSIADNAFGTQNPDSENQNESDQSSADSGLKIYAPADSEAALFAQNNSIELDTNVFSTELSTDQITEGDQTKVEVTEKADVLNDVPVTFSSSDENVATVSEDGTVTAVGNGSASITADTGDVTTTMALYVAAEDDSALDSTELQAATTALSTTTSSSLFYVNSNGKVLKSYMKRQVSRTICS